MVWNSRNAYGFNAQHTFFEVEDAHKKVEVLEKNFSSAALPDHNGENLNTPPPSMLGDTYSGLTTPPPPLPPPCATVILIPGWSLFRDALYCQ